VIEENKSYYRNNNLIGEAILMIGNVEPHCSILQFFIWALILSLFAASVLELTLWGQQRVSQN
jgi:hypothetical protein